MFAKRNLRKLPNEKLMQLSNEDGVSSSLELLGNCTFTKETFDGDSNLRLHRVMTDCLELTTADGGEFSYLIRL